MGQRKGLSRIFQERDSSARPANKEQKKRLNEALGTKKLGGKAERDASGGVKGAQVRRETRAVTDKMEAKIGGTLMKAMGAVRDVSGMTKHEIVTSDANLGVAKKGDRVGSGPYTGVGRNWFNK